MTREQHTARSNPGKPPFWRFAWEYWLIEQGHMSRLKPVERAVLWCYAIAADKNTRQAYWSARRLSEATGYVDKDKTYRSVRDARKSLAKKGLIACVKEGGGRLSDTYQIIFDDEQGHGACRDSSEPGARSKTRSEMSSIPFPGVPPRGTPFPPTPETTFPPPRNAVSGVTDHGTENKTAAACAEGPGLFDSAPATAAAAAELLVDFGLSRREAAGLISQYRPTSDQVRVVIANARAWLDAAARGERQPMRTPPKFFIASELQKRNFAPDPAVAAEQDRKAKQIQGQQREAERQIECRRMQAEAHARQQAEQRFDDLPASEQRRLMDAQRPDQTDGAITIKPSDVQLRGWAIDELTKNNSERKADEQA